MSKRSKKRKNKPEIRFSLKELTKGLRQDIKEQTTPNKPIGTGKAKLFIDVNK